MSLSTPRPRRRRLVAIAAGVATAMLALAGCAGSPGAAGTPKSDVTITFWHYFTDRADLLQKLADEYHDQTGVTVKLELVPAASMGQKFQAAAQSNTLPDISAGWVGASDVLAQYANDGQVLNLSKTPDADTWFQSFEPSTIQGVSYVAGNKWGVDPGAYLVPLDTNNMQILYNKKAFQDAGITSTPTDLSSFIDDSAKLRKAGYQPFVSGFSSWPLGSYSSMYIDNIVPASVRDAAYAGTGRYDAKEWVQFLDVFATMAKAGVFADGSVGYDMPAAESLFASGKAGMIFDGSWAIGVFNQTNPDFKDYGVFYPPSFGSNKLYIPGGVGSTAFVVGTSKHKDDALAFLKWLTEPKQQAEYANESFNIPANKTVADQMQLTPNIKAFADASADLTPPAKSGMQGPVTTTMTAGLQLIIAGKDTPEAVAARMQKALETNQAQ